MDNTYAGDLKLVGGRLCLDFTNTADWHAGSNPVDHIRNYDDLVVWAEHAEIVTEDQARRLRERAADAPQQAAEAHRRAIALREALFRLFSALAANDQLNPDDLTILNDEVNAAPPRTGIVYRSGQFGWTTGGADDALDRILWAVAWSAGDVLVGDDLNRIKRCPGDDCGWLFLDASRNGSRRWCAMEDCGNRAKVRRHYQAHGAKRKA
jgi:predicted RNA-binding Zn ribbon-like protein